MRALVVALALTLAPIPAAAAQLSDADLADRVATAIRGYVHFGIFDDISIGVENRDVTLNGRVTMPYKRADIEARVKQIDGVRSLTNKIEVLPVSIYDSELRQRLALAIYGHPSFRHYASMVTPPIHIVVENGRVTLTGAVSSNVEKLLAYSLAQIPGVLSVKNELKTDR
ncbi:MAG: BON domain-containing protein [Acidobacteria bacterium]|nr:MAG: BON domain-containing protein [Acidobacteriota bacterium]